MIERRCAGTVIPRNKDGFVLLGLRTELARSYPDYHAFPGGGVDASDADLPLLFQECCIENSSYAELACAVRELGEETGRWLLATPNGDVLSAPKKTEFIEAIAQQQSVLKLLKRLDICLDGREFEHIGLWVTKDSRPKRFEVCQFYVDLNDDHPHIVRTIDVEELKEIAWYDPRLLRTQWGVGQCYLLPPIRHVIVSLDACFEKSREDLLSRLKKVRPVAIPETQDMVEGICIQSYLTPTLRPATHTNTLLVGVKDFWIIDPATPQPEEQDRFDALLALLRAQGRQPLGILLTHKHYDHMADAKRVARKYRLRINAHAHTLEFFNKSIRGRSLKDGDFLECPGADPRGLLVLETPGHAEGHLCFLEEHTKTLIAGDMVAGRSSILIDPPEGNIQQYMSSLHKLLEYEIGGVIPAHGPLIAKGREKIEAQIAHREQRLKAVFACLISLQKPARPLEVATIVYGKDNSEKFLQLASRSVLAMLYELERKGLVSTYGTENFYAHKKS